MEHVATTVAADLRREKNRKRMARIRSKSKEVRDAVATTDLRSANVEDDALPSVSVIFFAVTPTSPEAGAVDDPTGRGGGVEAGGGDGEVTTLDPNHPARSGDDDDDDALPSASVFVAAVDDPANATAIIAGRGGGVEAVGGDGVGYVTCGGPRAPRGRTSATAAAARRVEQRSGAVPRERAADARAFE
jgi:hypothetical protein